MSLIDKIPKVILNTKKNENYKFPSSSNKLYRFDNILISAKIVILPEYINKNICNKSYFKNTSENINEDIFKIIKFLQETKIINDYNSTLTIDILHKKFKLYKILSVKNRTELEKKSKKNLIEIYKKECCKLNLNFESLEFLSKQKIIDLFLTNPINFHFYSHHNKYFISNSNNSNMKEGFRLSPIKNISVYEYILKMFSINLENFDELPDFFKKFKNENILISINYINVLQKPKNISSLYRLFIYIIEKELKEISEIVKKI